VRRSLAVALGCLALSAALLATACGKSQLDTSKLEDQIQTELAKRSGIEIQTVDCPDGVEARKGDKFTCSATTARNERVVIEVTQDDSKGAVTWRVRRPGR
jgi:hypothetical protein